MRKHLLAILLVLSLSIGLASQPAFAQEFNHFAVGIRGTYNMYQDDEVELFSTNFDTSYDNSLGVSFDFSYFFVKSFSLEFSLGYTQTDMEVGYSGDTEAYGTLTQIPILLTARYHFVFNDKVVPYIGAGIGYYLNDMDNADGNGDFFDGAPSGVESFADDAFGYHINAGVEFFIIDRLALNIDLKYVLMSTDIGFEGAGYDQSSDSKVDVFSTGVGIKYYF